MAPSTKSQNGIGTTGKHEGVCLAVLTWGGDPTMTLGGEGQTKAL